MSMKAKVIYAALLALLFMAGLWTASQNFLGNSKPPLKHLGGEFTLNSVNGPVSLSDFEGKLVAFYFGFMSCPEICPTALSSLAAGIRGLSVAEQEQVQPMFISIDPERDSLDNMAKYTSFFHPSMLGLTANLEYLQQLVKRYGAYFRHIPLENSDLSYTVDHTSRIYLIDQQGKLITTLPHGTQVAQIEAALRENL